MNEHLKAIFEEVLPALEDGGVKYWVFGGVGVAGIVGKFLRENQDVDVYVLEKDFPKVEPILKKLVEMHGGWDADKWDMRYSMLKTVARPKLDIFIEHVERFSVAPIYKTENGFEFRFVTSVLLGPEAETQEWKTIDGYTFASAPAEVVRQLLRFLAERYLSHRDSQKPMDPNSKHLIDARAILPRDEVEGYLRRAGITPEQ